MAQTQKLQFIIDAQNNADATLKSVSGSLDKFKSNVDSMQPAFRKMALVGTAAFVGIVAGVNSAVQAYAEVERSNRQLEHAVIDVSKGTMEQVKAIDAVAQALQKKAGVDADSVKMGAAQLSTFGLQSESIVKLTKTLADFTVNQEGVNASADSYVQSANTIAKALNGQFGILEKSGIRFTEYQQNLIKTGTESQKVAALQEGLAQNLRETTDTIGGVDVATAKYNRTMEDIKENIGKAMVPVMEALSNAIMPLITQFSEWAEKNPELLKNIILIGGAIVGLVAAVGILGVALPAIITGFTLLLGPVGLVALAIGALIAVGVLLYKHWDDIKSGAIIVWEGIKGAITTALQAISDFFTSIWQGIMSFLTTVGYFIIGLFAMILDTIWPGWQEGFQQIADFFMLIWNGIKVFFTTIVAAMKVVFQSLYDVFKNIWESIVGVFDWAKAKVTGVFDSIKEGIQPIFDLIDRLQAKLDKIGGAVKGAFNAVVQKGKDVLAGRAIGGPVTAGRPYMVGENGPEMFTPNSYGRIQTAKSTAAGGGVNITITGNTFMGKEGVAEMIGDEIIRSLGLRMKLS